MTETNNKDFKVLITSFGPFLDITTNPSHEITTRLPPTIPTTTEKSIQLIVHPTALPVSYHTVFDIIPELLLEQGPDLVIHMGLDVDRGSYFLETGAFRDGYHQVPDMQRKVFTRAEGKAAWGKLPERLETTLDLEAALERWRASIRTVGAGSKKQPHGKKGGKQQGGTPELALSDDVGSYICGFIYYLSLAWYLKNGNGKRPVAFFHVPMLQSEQELENGKQVTIALIKSLVEMELEG